MFVLLIFRELFKKHQYFIYALSQQSLFHVFPFSQGSQCRVDGRGRRQGRGGTASCRPYTCQWCWRGHFSSQLPAAGPPILWGNIRALPLRMICVQHWTLGSPSDLSSFVLQGASAHFRDILGPASCRGALCTGLGTWTPKCMGCDEQCRFAPHQGMVVERPRLTGSGSERLPPPSCFPLGLSSWALRFCIFAASTLSQHSMQNLRIFLCFTHCYSFLFLLVKIMDW